MMIKGENISIKTVRSDKPAVHVVISKKISQNATKRNLLKRRIRYAFNEIKQKPKSTIFLYGQKGLSNLNYGDLKKELFSLISKTKV